MVLNGVEIDIGDEEDDDNSNNPNTGGSGGTTTRSADVAPDAPRSTLSTPLASPRTTRDESTPPVRGRALPVSMPPPLSLPLAFPLSALPSPSSPTTATCASETRSPMRFQRENRPVTSAAS